MSSDHPLAPLLRELCPKRYPVGWPAVAAVLALDPIEIYELACALGANGVSLVKEVHMNHVFEAELQGFITAIALQPEHRAYCEGLLARWPTAAAPRASELADPEAQPSAGVGQLAVLVARVRIAIAHTIDCQCIKQYPRPSRKCTCDWQLRFDREVARRWSASLDAVTCALAEDGSVVIATNGAAMLGQIAYAAAAK